MPALIELDQVRKTYNAGLPSEAEVLHGLQLRVDQGEFIALIGPSGSGKSTLLNIVGLLERMTSGSYRLQGEEVHALDDAALTLRRRNLLGFVFQFHHLLPAFTALENVTMPALMAEGRVTPKARDKARELLAAVGLAKAIDKRPGQLSGGMQQRVAICRALITDPAILLMDEPFGALDAMTREHMNLELQRIWMESRKTVFLITHSIQEAVFLSDRVIVMTSRPGRIDEIVPIDLPRPRSFDLLADERFGAYAKHIRAKFGSQAMFA